MSTREPFDPLIRFGEIERLVSKIYFRFSHLFFPKPELRDFWWEMAKEEEQHACIRVLMSLPWKSNVRELDNVVIEHTMILAKGIASP